MFGSLVKLVTAPLEIVDELVLKPVAEAAEEIVEACKPDPDDRR